MGIEVFITTPKSNKMVSDPGNIHAILGNKTSFKQQKIFKHQNFVIDSVSEGNEENTGIQLSS